MNASLPRWLLFLVAAGASLTAEAEYRSLTVNPNGGVKDANATSDATRSFLRWKNGEYLYGELDHATPDEVFWKSPLFAEPIALRASHLKVMEAPMAGVTSKEPFMALLRNGDLVHGSLVSIDAGLITLRSDCHGEVKMRRSEVVSLRRTSGGRLLYASPAPGIAWRMKDDRNAQARTTKYVWKTGANGAPVMHSWNRTNFLPLNFQMKMEVEFHLRCSASPRFRLDLNASNGASPSLETWDDTLVLVQGGRFAAVLDFKPEDRDANLRLCWDREARRSMVFDSQGNKLAELTEGEGPRRGLSETGIYIRNTGLSVSLVSLRVRQWNGAEPAKGPPGEPRVLRNDGSLERGAVSGADEKTIRVANPAGGETPVSLDDVEAIILAADPEKTESTAVNEVAFNDGSFLSGKLLEINEGSARLETPWSQEPVSAKMAGAKIVRFAVPVPAGEPEARPLEEMDRLVVGKSSIHGTPIGSDDGILRWMPTGGVHPVPLVSGTQDAEVIRAIPPDAAVAKPQALFFVEGGDVLPGALRGIDENFVRLQSGIAEATELRAPLCYAIQFSGPEVKGAGFEDPGWRRVKGDAKSATISGDALTLGSGGAFGHPSMMQADELKFSLGTQQGYGVMRVRLFTDDFKAQGRGVPLLLMRSGDQLSCGIESENGNGFDDRGQFTVPYGKPVEVRIMVQDKTVEIMVGDVSLQKLPAPPEKRAGLGVLFELANIWGNGERPMTVSKFSARLNAERIWFPPVDQEARLHALTIPRFRRDDLPAHVLVAANGDLLRGRIEAATAEHFRFRSGLEMLNVPRSRVTAAIRLTPPPAAKGGKPAETKTAPAPVAPGIKPTHWLLLRDGGRLGLAVEKFTADRIIGRSPDFGRCEVPMDLVHVIRFSAPALTSAMTAFQSWKLEHLPDPVLPATGGQSSPLLGKDAPAFKIPLLGGGEFELAKEKGKVVILDFWATWCGPCVKSLPELIEAMDGFDQEKVRLIGVNQAETSPVVQKFLEQRGWKLTVALDSSQSIGRQFGVEGIPHTVIVGSDGRIGWVKTGYDPGGAKEAASAVRKMLEAPASAPK